MGIDLLEERLLMRSSNPPQPDLGVRQVIHDAFEEWLLPARVPQKTKKSQESQDRNSQPPPHQELPEQKANACSHPCSQQMPATGQEAHEKLSFERQIRACDMF